MKNSILILLLVLSSSAFGQTLNVEGEFLKQKRVDQYEAIKEFSEKKWGEDHARILNEINEQSKAFIGLMEYLTQPPRGFENILIKAMEKGSDGRLTPDLASNKTIDYKIVLHEIEEQLKAKASN